MQAQLSINAVAQRLPFVWYLAGGDYLMAVKV
jgi:hypothetical protein